MNQSSKFARRGLVALVLVVLLITGFALTTNRPILAQSGITTIKYGDIVNGTIGADKDSNAALYRFRGEAGDIVSIMALTTSGDLKPFMFVSDATDPQNPVVLVKSPTTVLDTIAEISDFKLPKTQSYILLVTHQGLDNGTTAGDFTLFLVKGDLTSTTGEATPTPRSPRPISTAKPPSRPTVTPNLTPTDQPTDEPPSDQATAAPTSPVASSGAALTMQSFKVGKSPNYSLWTGNNLYVANSGDGTVSELDGDGNVVNTLNVGGSPFTLGWDGSRLWVADPGTSDAPIDIVTLYNSSGKRTAAYKVGKEPFSLSYDKQDGWMWIALFADKKIVAVDSKGKTVLSVATDTNPNTVLWTGDKLWATLGGSTDNPGNSVITVDTKGSITETFPVGSLPPDLAWNDVDQVMYVPSFTDGTITTLDSDGTVLGTFPVGHGPSAVAFDGSQLWVALYTDQAIAAFSSKGKSLAVQPLTYAPNSVIFDGNGHVWVAESGGDQALGDQVTVIDTASASSPDSKQ